MRGRRIFDHVDPYLAPPWRDEPEEPALTIECTCGHPDALYYAITYRQALEEIRDQDWVENCLDPQWAARIAAAALSEKEN